MSLRISALLVVCALPSACPAIDVLRVDTQRVGATTYFLLAIEPPKDFVEKGLPGGTRVEEAQFVEDFFFPAPGEAAARACLQVPRLVSSDGQTRAVHFGGTIKGELVFLGKRVGKNETATFRLTYPAKAKRRKGLAGLPEDNSSSRDSLTVAWRDARAVAPPATGRGEKQYPVENDLQGRHAWAQATSFGRLELRAPKAGLFSVSRLLTGRKYGVPAAPLARASATTRVPLQAGPNAFRPDLYSLFTGAAHLDEAVMLQRLQNPAATGGARTIGVDTLPKVALAEHDWKKMMADNKPAAEPLAKVAPHDCYYLTVSSLASFASAWGVIDAWGGSVLRPPQLSDRDHGLRARYERQLCLPLADLLKTVPAGALRSAALVGSDLYWAEGSDVTVLFDAADKKGLLSALAEQVARTTKPFGNSVKAARETYRGVAIDGWRTPAREVSAYRAELGDIVACSNSPAALRRVIDVQAGKAAALADSLDFQYMRTVFLRDAKAEDGFVFLSDAFIRRLVNAPTRIKAMRRSQARAALTLASHAALFAGHETGRLPADTAGLLRDCGLGASSLVVPDGKAVAWDGSRRQALSEVYGTLEYGTPLVELMIDEVTGAEAEGFRQFQRGYLLAWSKFFDPVGMRFSLKPGKTRVEIFILPLINSQEYGQLQGIVTDRGLMRYDPRRTPVGTVFQAILNLQESNTVGDWLLFHLHGKGLKMDQLARAAMEEDLLPGRKTGTDGRAALLSSRLTMGLAVKDSDALSKGMQWLYGYIRPKPEAAVLEHAYRRVRIKEAPVDYDKVKGLLDFARDYLPIFSQLPAGGPPRSPLYQTEIDKGYYLSFNKKAIKGRIDLALDTRKAKCGETQAVHAALYFAPPTGKAGKALSAYFDWRSHVKAQSALALWEGLYGGGLVTPAMTPAARDAAARRLLGFVPVSPDGAAMAWREKNHCIASTHHGTLAAPRFRAGLPEGSPIARLLAEIRSVNAGLRFREDGLHTTITLDWAAGK